MTIPIYDQTTLPCLSLPMKNTHGETARYLGNRAVTGDISLTVKVIPKSDIEAKALYDFWATDCNFGLEPFLAPIPIFGNTVDKEFPKMLVQFYGHFSMDKNSVIWGTELKLKLIGTIDYVVDGLGDFIVSDAGEYTVTANGDYVPTGNTINSYREVVYAS